MKEQVEVPTVDQIISDTAENYSEIVNNIARINSVLPSELSEDPSNTNMLLLLKRYINGLKETKLIIPTDTLVLVHKLLMASDNVTNSTFVRISELLELDWEILMINPNHQMILKSDGSFMYDVEKNFKKACTLQTMLSTLMRYTLDMYGEVDLKRNTEYIPSYSVNNIVAAVRKGKNISAYIFEKFNKLWNISYSYTITSRVDGKVSKTITLDPSGWM